MSDEFFRTRMGAKFYESDVPRIATALEAIASTLSTETRITCSAKDCEELVSGLCGTHARELQDVWVVTDRANEGDPVVFANVDKLMEFFHDLIKLRNEMVLDDQAKLRAWRNHNITRPLTLCGVRCVRVGVR